MVWQPGIYSFLAFASAGIASVVILLALRHRYETGARAFLGVMVAVAAWSFVYAVQLGFTTQGAQYALFRVVLVLTSGVPAFWVVFTLQYTGRGGAVPTRAYALLAVEPLLFAVFTLTNGLHGLVVRAATLVPIDGTFALLVRYGTVYYAHIGYSYLLFVTGVGLLVAEYRRAEFYRTKLGLLIVGPVPAFFAHLAYTAGLTWGPLPAVDLTPILYAVTGMAFGVVQFDLLDPVPVARAQALNATNDGFVVLDRAETVVSLNPAARRILDGPAVGQSFWGSYPGTVEEDASLDAIDGTTFTTRSHGRPVTTDVSASPLTDRHGHHLGWVVSLRDVSDRHAYQQRLEVANRVLRHNLRNQMNVIHGWADHIASSGPDEYTDAARRITATADTLIELSEKTRTLVATTNAGNGESRPVEVTDRVDATVEEFEAEYPSVRIEVRTPGEAMAAVPDASLVDIAVRNLLENAILHNDAPEPRVSVVVDAPADERAIRVSVSDNGPGIPEVERRVLEEGSETPLRHGSGMGLWLVYWCVTAAGGDVAFESNDPRGSVVSFTLPTPRPADGAGRSTETPPPDAA